MGLPENVEEVRETLRKIQQNLECPICLELLSDPYTTQCSHPFCRTCIYTVISSTREAKCPLCKMPISRRSMNENVRLAEIVEAVKELEQAITKDSGVPSTPPRPLPPHSHEATGTPGVIIHSLLHPTPQKPPGTHREVTITGRDSGNNDSGYEMRPAVASTDTSSNRQVHGTHRKRVRFASTKLTSRRKKKISWPESSTSNQTALLRALEEVDFVEPDITSNSFVHSESRPQNVSAIPQLEAAGEEDKWAGGATAAVDREADLNSPERKRPRKEQSWDPNNGFESISRVLETPGVVVARLDQLEPLEHTLHSLANRNQIDPISRHFNQDGEAVGDASTQRISHSPWLVPGSSCTTAELVEHTPRSVHSAEMTSETPWIKTVQETPYINGGSQHQRIQDQYHSAESHLELSPHKQETLDSDTMVLAEETQFTEPSTGMQANAEGSAAPCAVEETQIASAHSQIASQGIPVQSVVPPMPTGDTNKQGSPQVHCVSETQPECQTHEVYLGSVPANYCKSATKGSASNSPSLGGGDSTVSLSPPSSTVKNSATSLATPQPSLGHKSKGNHSTEHLHSTNSTTPDLLPEFLQNGLQISPNMSSTQANAPTCSSPKFDEVSILPPPFVSPPLTEITPQWRNSSHFDNHMLSSLPSLNHSISPSIPLQNTYTCATAPRSNPSQEKTVIPDTYCTVKSGVSKVSETQLESVPSSQLSLVALAVHNPPLPGLYKALSGCLPWNVREHDVTASTSSPSSHGHKSSPTNGKSYATLPSQPSQSAASPPVPTFLQLTNSQVTPNGDGCPPPPPLLPDSLTVIPDSLLKHQPSLSHDSTARSSPHGTVNAASELSVSTSSSSTTLQRRSPGGILSPGRDTCSQWDVKSSSFSQDLTSQELEVLRQQMEEKEREILELEALLLQGKKRPSAGAQPQTNGSMQIPDSVDTINISLATVAPEDTCHSDCQPDNSQPPAAMDGKGHSLSPNTPVQISSTAGHQSPEITVVGETIPDSFPAITLSGTSKGAPGLSDSKNRLCFVEHEPSSNDNKVECDFEEYHQGRMVSPSNAMISKTDSQHTTQDPSTASSYSSTRSKALLQKADVLLKSLRQPLPLTETPHSPDVLLKSLRQPLPLTETPHSPDVLLKSLRQPLPLTETPHSPDVLLKSLRQPLPLTETPHSPDVLLKSLRQPLPLTETPHSPDAHHSTKAVDLEVPRCLSPSVMHSVIKGNGRIPTPLISQKEKEINQTHSRGKISPRNPPVGLKKPSPKTSNEVVLETATKLIKALRSPPKVVLESQTTLEVDTGFFHVSPSAGSNAAAKTVQPKAQGSTKHQRNTKSRSPMPPAARQKAGLSSKPKKKRPLVVLDSQDLERSSPPPHGVPLPSNHPFLSISTSPHQTASKLNVCYPGVSEAATTVGNVSGTHAGPCDETCSLVKQHKSTSDSTTSKDQAFPHEQQSANSHTVEGKTKCIKSAVGTLYSQLSGSARPAESPPSCTTGGSDHTKLPSFIASGLTKAQLYQAQILAKNHGGRIASCFNGCTTHVIVLTDGNGCCPRTVKYLQGLAAGKWIVGYNWVEDSLEAGMLLPEAGYEVRGDSVCGRNAPCKAHKLRGAGEPGLFHHYSFYLAGLFSGISQDHLAQLIQLADGTLTPTFPQAMDSRTILICDNQLTDAPACEDLTVLPSSWVLDSLSQYYLLPAEKYQHYKLNSP